MRKSILVLLLLIILSANSVVLASDQSHSTPVQLNVDAANFSVTVPTNLPVTVDASGNVTCASGAKVVNNGHGQIKITAIKIVGTDGWSIVKFDTDMTKEKVDSKKLGMKINTFAPDLVTGFFNIPVEGITLDGANASDSDECAITYEAVLSAQSSIINNTPIANIIFTVGWSK